MKNFQEKGIFKKINDGRKSQKSEWSDLFFIDESF